MPRRHRRTRNHLPIPWTPQLSIALVCGPDPSIPKGHPDYLDDALLGSAWGLYGPRVMASVPATSCWGWWAFHGTVPPELRGRRPQLVPEEDHPAYRQELDDLREARARWLAALNSTSPT